MTFSWLFTSKETFVNVLGISVLAVLHSETTEFPLVCLCPFSRLLTVKSSSNSPSTSKIWTMRSCLRRRIMRCVFTSCLFFLNLPVIYDLEALYSRWLWWWFCITDDWGGNNSSYSKINGPCYWCSPLQLLHSCGLQVFLVALSGGPWLRYGFSIKHHLL